jgi:hypothetical protein
MLNPSIRSGVRSGPLTRGGMLLIVLVIVSLGVRADVSIPILQLATHCRHFSRHLIVESTTELPLM